MLASGSILLEECAVFGKWINSIRLFGSMFSNIILVKSGDVGQPSSLLSFSVMVHSAESITDALCIEITELVIFSFLTLIIHKARQR